MDARDHVAVEHQPADPATAPPAATMRRNSAAFAATLLAAGIQSRSGDAPNYIRTDLNLGFGAFGCVSLAYRHTGDGVWGRSAIKFLCLHRCETIREVLSMVAMAGREIELCRRVQDSRHVVAMHEPWFDRRTSEIALPMEAGDCSLADYAEACDYTYEPLVLLSICVQCTRALEAVHRRGVLHRDVKPENFVVNCDAAAADLRDVGALDGPHPPYVRIADFGLACGFEEQRHLAHRCVGTPYYMAPEVIGEDGPAVTLPAARDVWSLGVTFFRLATGDMPDFDCDIGIPAVALGKCRRRQHSPPSPWRTASLVMPATNREGRPFPPEVRAVLSVAASMLAFDPRHRPALAGVRRQLEAIAAVPEPDLSYTAVPVYRLRVCRPEVTVRVYAVPQAVEEHELSWELEPGETILVEGEVRGWARDSCDASLYSLPASMDRRHTRLSSPLSQRIDSLPASPLQRARSSVPPPPPETDTWLRIVYPWSGYCCRFHMGQHVLHVMRDTDDEETTQMCPPLRAESHHRRHTPSVSMSPPSSHVRHTPTTAPLYVDASLHPAPGHARDHLAPCVHREASPPIVQPAQQLMWTPLLCCCAAKLPSP